jgi:WD40 repeat protein
VITGSRDKTMKVFDLQSGMEFRMFKGHVGRVLCVAITSVGHLWLLPSLLFLFSFSFLLFFISFLVFFPVGCCHHNEC